MSSVVCPVPPPLDRQRMLDQIARNQRNGMTLQQARRQAARDLGITYEDLYKTAVKGQTVARTTRVAAPKAKTPSVARQQAKPPAPPPPTTAWKTLDKAAAKAAYTDEVAATMRKFAGHLSESDLRKRAQAATGSATRDLQRMHLLGDHRIEVRGTLSSTAERELLDTFQELLEKYPPSSPARITVGPKDLKGGTFDRRDFGETILGKPTIALNSTKINAGSMPHTHGFMPSASSTSPARYTAVHEYGHAIDDGLTQVIARSSRLSKYATESRYEATAESFAEWFLTRGTTANDAVREYARMYKWRVP